MRHLVVSIALVLVLAPTGSLAAQRDTLGAIEGTIHERSSYRSVLTAKVTVRRVEPDTTVAATTTPDANGRFRLDSIPPGRYRARVLSPALDSLLVPPPETDVLIAPGRVVLADFTLPTGTTLRDLICRGSRLPEGGPPSPAACSTPTPATDRSSAPNCRRSGWSSRSTG